MRAVECVCPPQAKRAGICTAVLAAGHSAGSGKFQTILALHMSEISGSSSSSLVL